jgi:hypothetical protein
MQNPYEGMTFFHSEPDTPGRRGFYGEHKNIIYQSVIGKIGPPARLAWFMLFL